MLHKSTPFVFIEIALLQIFVFQCPQKQKLDGQKGSRLGILGYNLVSFSLVRIWLLLFGWNFPFFFFFFFFALLFIAFLEGHKNQVHNIIPIATEGHPTHHSHLLAEDPLHLLPKMVDPGQQAELAILSSFYLKAKTTYWFELSFFSQQLRLTTQVTRDADTLLFYQHNTNTFTIYN